VIASLEKLYSVSIHPIDNPMFLRDTSAPATSEVEAQGFGLADAIERIGNDSFHQVKDSKSQFTICLNPVAEVVLEIA